MICEELGFIISSSTYMRVTLLSFFTLQKPNSIIVED